MNKKNLIRLLPLLLPALLLTGCAHTVKNPYQDYSSEQLRNVSAISLCNVVGDEKYIVSQKVNREAGRRGFVDCAYSEVYCYAQLHLKPGSKDFATCRLLKDEAEANRRLAQSIATSAMISAMQPKTYNVNVNHTGYVNMYHSGYINNYGY